MTFKLNDEQWARFKDWKVEQDSEVTTYGATGGGYTYSFTPTSLGCVTKVTNNVTGETLDLTDYDSW
jgi:hypothetical protein